ncbi:phage minor head protein [Chelatococcus sp.]|uniref:phage head morphogenesis protein n=1 Tax=Chelatococcus sp. TaxID=1953771 RepID=UPI001EB7EA4C|nr:phage minor head protein [Chelatococcus sp.]MBX3545579.1 hypothetical protein [Chelatococcus sp.]
MAKALVGRVQKGFTVPPEVPRYFADKSLKPGFSYLDTWAQEHAYSFTVAKAVETELLTAFRDSIAKAIDAGQGFETWREGIRDELARLGWWGKRLVDDPDGGPAKLVDFSSPRRLRTIFWSNLRSARAAGQWERMQRGKRALPYILYVRTTSSDPRQEHLSWVGIILPIDDPFWSTHFPPNGWMCKCTVRQISGRERDKLLEAEKGEAGIWYVTEAPPVTVKPFLNRRTGEVTAIPAGIDPGWHTNPGLARASNLVESLQNRLDAAGPTVARKQIAELMETPAPKVLMNLPERVRMPVAVSEGLQQQLAAKSPVVAISNDTMRAKTAKHRPVVVETFSDVQTMLDQGEVIDEKRGDDQRSVFVEREGGWWKAVVKRSARGFLRIQTLFRTDKRGLERAKRRQEETK